MRPLERSWILALGLLAGCAAEPGARPPADDLHDKQEALVGAPCRTDDGCDRGEHCDRVLCIPEAEHCPEEGVCRAITRWYDPEGAAIPDADPAGVERTIVVDRPPASVARLHVSATIRHTWRGDLRVVLRSPAGTERVLHDRAGGSADDLTIGADLTSVFEGEPAHGAWTLRVSDHARRDTGRIATWRLELDYAAPSDEGPGHDVWATVALPAAESAHPYANDEASVHDLSPMSAGATRARIRFARIDVERGYDVVEVYDTETGEVLDRFSGRHDAFTTRAYPTGHLAIRLLSDRSITRWGYRAEAVEVFGLGCLSSEECGEGYECPTERIRCVRWPCFTACQPRPTGGEGDACAADVDCGEELYCAADATCRGFGTCGEAADCEDPSNPWIHVLCVGTASCDAGACAWHCGEPLECTDGETRDDGCNTCTCTDGRWACTERYCPPVAEAGEPCPAGTVCAEGLICDRGRIDLVPTCGSEHVGTCVPEAERLCTMEHAPVCACNGQTFPNECHRIGVADYAHDGECALAVAIPDADAEGIVQTLEVTRPAGTHRADVEVRIDHSWRGDLVVWVEAPDGSRHVLTNREGGRADDFAWGGTIDLDRGSATGTWTLHVSDRASWDTGVLRFFNVRAG
ncbi:MAG TPA: proprotein convertase P-domain-containing protein [Sandaracinaceae bacterium LLY-WYZ-13_1]|nr:proprotein convertase P-domain-containing protein [Sandaracinaceae bacterium LLY-WYZ-13_1]